MRRLSLATVFVKKARLSSKVEMWYVYVPNRYLPIVPPGLEEKRGNSMQETPIE